MRINSRVLSGFFIFFESAEMQINTYTTALIPASGLFLK